MRKLDPENFTLEPSTRHEVAWLALTVLNADKARTILAERFGFHPVAIEDAISEHERPGQHVGDSYVFVTIPVVEESDGETRYIHLGLFTCTHALVSVTTHGCTFADEWFERWAAHPAEVGPTSDMLLQELVDSAVDEYFPALDKLQAKVDVLEESVYQGERIMVGSAVRIRRSLLEMRRQVTPIRDVLNSLLRRDTPVVRPETRTYMQDVYDHSLRLLESIDLNRDVLTSIMDAQLSMTSNRLNEVMRNMTSLATILMGMALITGVYGMNFEHMPELRWKYGYFAVVALLLVVFFGGLWVARKIGWLTVNLPKRK